MPRRSRDRYEDEGNVWDEEEPRRTRRVSNHREEEESPRPPLMLRVLAWVGIILLCFVGGYLGTSWGIKLLGKQDLLSQNDVVKSTEELSNFLDSDSKKPKPADQIDAKKVTFQLYYPKGTSLTSEAFDVITSLRENEIEESMVKLFSLSGMFPQDVSVKRVFRNASTLYLDISGPFIQMLSDAGKEKSALFITGIVRTMKENFPPITDIRFLINGTITTAGSPVDLTASWKLPE